MVDQLKQETGIIKNKYLKKDFLKRKANIKFLLEKKEELQVFL